MTTALTFGGWLKRRRSGLGLTQKELASRVGYAAVTLRKVESDELRPSWQMAQRLAEVLELAPDEQVQFVRFACDEAHWDDVALPAHATPPIPPASEQQEAAPAELAAVRPASPPSAAAHLPTNLPAPLTSFVGREGEVAAVMQLVGTQRLVTLTGVGGVGKTRLAIEAGIQLVRARTADPAAGDLFADGVWLVELAALADGSLVAATIARQFGLQETTNRPALDLLRDYLAPKRLLLILDNCEHLVDACAVLADYLLQRCWQLHILATSREDLRVPGEASCTVLPLTLPHPMELRPEHMLGSAAARLFLARMRGTEPSLPPSAEDATAIAHICRQLDGIPLALELAAPLTRNMALAQIAEQLHDQMAILTNSYRTAIPRHQTMHSALLWSYRLLSPVEHQLLAQVSVFAGGWTWAACQAISGAELDEVLEYSLHQLVAKSFVLLEFSNGERRFRLLEPIRQFARAQLAAAGDPEITRRRHAEYYLSLAEQMGLARDTPQEREHLQQLSPERDNLRAVNQWCLEHNEAEFAQRFNGLLFAYWHYSSNLKEASYWLEAALDLQESRDSTVRTLASLTVEAMARDTAGYAAVLQHDYALAQSHFERELVLCRQTAVQKNIATAMRGIGFTAMLSGDLAQAQLYAEQALAISQAAGDRWGIAWVSYDLGYLALARGELDPAQSQLEASLPQLREQGNNWGTYRALQTLGRVTKAQGDLHRARWYFFEALRLQQVIQYTNFIAEVLEGVAGLKAQTGQPTLAARIFAAAHTQREVTFWPRWRDQEAAYAAELALARNQFDSATWEENWALGCGMTLDQAVALALVE